MNNYLCIIGASNIDITGFSRHKLIPRDSNMGTLKMALGLAAMDICDKLDVAFIQKKKPLIEHAKLVFFIAMATFQK